jgi:hypothetical protein
VKGFAQKVGVKSVEASLGTYSNIKTCLGLYQIISSMPITLALAFPEAFDDFLATAAVLFLDIASLLQIDCVSLNSGLYLKTCFMWALPLVIVLLVSLPSVWNRKHRTVCINTSFFIVFALYPIVSRVTFRVFSCRSLDEDEAWHMDDTKVNCNAGSHLVFQVVAGCFVVVYPLGRPAAVLGLMLYNRKHILQDFAKEERDAAKKEPQKQEQEHKYTREVETSVGKSDVWYIGGKDKFEFLVGDFRKSVFYFETVDLMRKLALTGIVVFVQRGKVRGLVSITSLCKTLD